MFLKNIYYKKVYFSEYILISFNIYCVQVIFIHLSYLTTAINDYFHEVKVQCYFILQLLNLGLYDFHLDSNYFDS